MNGNPAASNMSYAWLIICFVPTARNLEVWGTIHETFAEEFRVHPPRKHPSLSSRLKILVIANFAGPCSRSSASICSCQNWIRYFFRDAWRGGNMVRTTGRKEKQGASAGSSFTRDRCRS